MNQVTQEVDSADIPAAGSEAEFWQHLVGAHWEKSSASFESVPASLWRPDPPEAFRMLTWCSEHMADSEVRLFHHRSDHTVWQLYSGPEPEVLPTCADGSFANYHARMRRAIGSADGYSIFVNEVIKNDPAAWKGVRDFVRGLVQRIGLPIRGFDSGLGLGEYDFTPFGLHVDLGRSAFIVPIVGRKHFRIWPGQYVRQHRELARSRGNYGALVKDSVELAAGPGGVMYWPSDAWHVAEGAGEFTAMLAVGALLGNPHGLTAVPCDVDNLQASAQHVPDGFMAAIQGTHFAKRSPAVEQVWIGFLSGLGLRYPFPVLQDALPQGRLRGQQRYPLIWRPLPDGQFAIGVNGHCLVESGGWLQELMERINTGVPFEAAELASGADGPMTQALLARLWACGALQSETQLQQTREISTCPDMSSTSSGSSAPQKAWAAPRRSSSSPPTTSATR